jgi:hypothetical protein
MTSQEWMRLGYPVWVSAALEELNTDEVEREGKVLYEPEYFATMDVWDQLDVVLDWNGIIGYTSNILEAVRGLDRMKGTGNAA